MDGEAISTLVIAAFVATFLVVRELDPIDSFTADRIDCVQRYQNRSCARKLISGFWKVSLNKAAGTCAMLIRDRESNSSTMYSGSLAYIDSKNWRCKHDGTRNTWQARDHGRWRLNDRCDI